MTALVGVASLIASGNDRAGRNAACAQNCGINFCPQQFGGERLPLPAQSLSRARFRRFQHFNRAFESSFCDPQGPSHHFNLFVGFGFTLRPEKSVGRANADFVCREFLRVTKRKICGHSGRSHASFFQKMGQHFLVRRRLFRFPLQLALELAEQYEFISISLLAATIDFQIAQDQCPFAVALKENEWIGRPKLRRVKHVGILLARSDDKACRFSFCFTHKISQSGSAHFQLFSQDPVQHDKQYECGHDQHHSVESEHAERDSEIAFLKTEEHVGLITAAVVVLLHLGP